MRKPTAKQKEVYAGKPLAAEPLVKRWLKKRGYTILPDPGRKKISPKFYDIMASKAGERYIIDVKTMKEPTVNIDSIEKMTRVKGFKHIVLAFVRGKRTDSANVYWFELNKQSLAGHKAAKARAIAAKLSDR